MSATPVQFSTRGTVALVSIDNPPVNALSPVVIQGLMGAWAEFHRRPELTALVMHCAGRTWIAGADIASLNPDALDPKDFNAALLRLESETRPVVAALHGTALGGGLEVAMAAHWRIAAPGTQVGLPEVKLGLLPGSLGTQRLPRIAGVKLALDLMLSGRMLPTAAALEATIIDEVTEQPLLAAAIARAEALAAGVQAGTATLRRASALTPSLAGLADGALDAALAEARKKPQYPAPIAIVQCVQAAATLPFAEGAQVEARLFKQLLASPQAEALCHLFFAERAAAKIPGLPAGTATREVRQVGIVGAGTMGGGFAMTFANAGFPVVLVEATAEALDRGMGLIRANWQATVDKGRLEPEAMAARLARITPSLAYDDLAGCDLVIEAVFEDMALKQQIGARLGRIAKPGAIIATNTSTLDVDQIAQATGRPADVLGMHFFSPAHVMRLLEVVRGAATAPDALATVMKLAPKIGKVAVVSGVCYGFIGNRMAEAYMREAEFLLLEGASPAQIDGAIEGLGLAMGPCRMLDMAGVDVGAKTVIELDKAGGLPADPTYRIVCRALFEAGRFGQKTGHGYYRYEGRKAVPSEETAALCAALAARHGIARRSDIGSDEIVERLMYAMVNEGARILDEGIAYRGSDIDIVWTAGYGFPDHRGGPMCFADQQGLARVVERLQHWGRVRGNPHGYWTVSPLLERVAAEGGRLRNTASPRWRQG